MSNDDIFRKWAGAGAQKPGEAGQELWLEAPQESAPGHLPHHLVWTGQEAGGDIL